MGAKGGGLRDADHFGRPEQAVKCVASIARTYPLATVASEHRTLPALTVFNLCELCFIDCSRTVPYLSLCACRTYTRRKVCCIFCGDSKCGDCPRGDSGGDARDADTERGLAAAFAPFVTKPFPKRQASLFAGVTEGEAGLQGVLELTLSLNNRDRST